MNTASAGLPLFECLPIRPETQAYLRAADQNFAAAGHKEHGIRHARLTASIAGNLLRHLSYDVREIQRATIAGYLHDIGNAVSRHDHAQAGALIALDILEGMGAPYPDIFSIINAVGSHEDREIDPSSPVAAAVILGDKTDVHIDRARSMGQDSPDTHARVNLACRRSFLRVNKGARVIGLELEIDTSVCSVMEYFEIFLSRMQFCRRASASLGCAFSLTINKDVFL